MSDTILRQIKMIELIPRQPRSYSSKQIKDKLDEFGLEASMRTVQRDLNELSRIFPIECDDRSIPYGWCWEKNAAGFSSPAMDPTQALTFSLASQYLEPLLPKSHLKSVEDFFNKAEEILLGNEKSKVSRWRKRVKVIPESIRFKRPNVKKDIDIRLHEAVFESLQIKAIYKKRGNKFGEKRIIHPLGIVLKGSMNYLICMMDEDPEKPRYLPFNRFEEVEILAEKIKEPKNFDFDSFIHENNLSFAYSKELYYFEAIFDRTMGFHLLETPLNHTQTHKELADDKIFIRARITDTLQFEQWIMSFGDKVEVLKPKKLRNKFIKLAKKMGSIYK